MKGGQKWATALETLCYASTICDGSMNEDGHKKGDSFVATENPQLLTDEAENSGVKNLEEHETYEEGSMHYERATQVKFLISRDLVQDFLLVEFGGIGWGFHGVSTLLGCRCFLLMHVLSPLLYIKKRFHKRKKNINMKFCRILLKKIINKKDK